MVSYFFDFIGFLVALANDTRVGIWNSINRHKEIHTRERSVDNDDAS